MQFYWGVRGGKKNKWLNLDGDLGDWPIRNPAITQQISG